MSHQFWEVIDAQLKELQSAATADDVMRILAKSRDPYGPDHGTSTEAFFAGSGGDGTVMDSLIVAGWDVVWAQAHYYWVMKAPNGDLVTYIEGDLYRGDTAIR